MNHNDMHQMQLRCALCDLDNSMAYMACSVYIASQKKPNARQSMAKHARRLECMAPRLTP